LWKDLGQFLQGIGTGVRATVAKSITFRLGCKNTAATVAGEGGGKVSSNWGAEVTKKEEVTKLQKLTWGVDCGAWEKTERGGLIETRRGGKIQGQNQSKKGRAESSSAKGDYEVFGGKQGKKHRTGLSSIWGVPSHVETRYTKEPSRKLGGREWGSVLKIPRGLFPPGKGGEPNFGVPDGKIPKNKHTPVHTRTTGKGREKRGLLGKERGTNSQLTQGEHSQRT